MDVVQAVARQEEGFNASVARRANEIRDQIVAIHNLSNTTKDN